MKFLICLILLVLIQVCVANTTSYSYFDECDVCGNNTVCLDTYNTTTPHCKCLPGFESSTDPVFGGVPCTDVDECSVCGANTRCDNVIGMYRSRLSDITWVIDTRVIITIISSSPSPLGATVARCYCVDGYQGDPSYPGYADCIPCIKECLPFILPLNAQIISGSCTTASGSTCTVSCDSTYTTNGTLDDATTFTPSCSDGQWTDMHRCVPIPGEWVSTPYVRLEYDGGDHCVGL